MTIVTPFNPNPTAEEAAMVQDIIVKHTQQLDWRDPAPLSDWSVALLQAANRANPYWMQAVLYGAYVMIQRRSKHSGQNHPFFNFVDIWRRRRRRSVKDVFMFLVDLKLARLTASDADFADDSQVDGWVDAMNYLALAAGYFLAGLLPKDVIPELEAKELPWEQTRSWDRVWPVICIDLNGVLDTYAGWTGQYEDYAPRAGAREFLAALQDKGYHVVVCTAQPSERLMEIEAWALEHDLSDYIDLITNEKPPAVAYLDDRAVRFDGSYDDALTALTGFKAYWQTGDHASA